MKTAFEAIIASGALALSLQATAAPIFSSSSTVTTTDRAATFDSLTANGILLSAYSENLLSVVVDDTTFQNFEAFSPGDPRITGFHYGTGGNSTFVTIKGTDDASFVALDFLLGNGFFAAQTNVHWETYLNGSLTGSGNQIDVANGTIVGWSDVSGFDELRVAAGPNVSPGFGTEQAIAIDDLRAQLVGGAVVPEPASLALLGLGLLGLGFSRRRKS